MRFRPNVMTVVNALLLIAASSASPLARVGNPTAEGLWERLDSSGNPEAEFRITDCNGLYQGKIVKIFPRPGEDPSTLRCSECEGDQKNAPVIGLTFIKGMRREGLEYRDGTILDPRDGSVYDAQMELSPDGQTLSVRGYLGIPLLGESEVWHRASDEPDRLDRSQPCSS
jgi:uncharacterized protein (DUF2147 family)